MGLDASKPDCYQVIVGTKFYECTNKEKFEDRHQSSSSIFKYV